VVAEEYRSEDVRRGVAEAFRGWLGSMMIGTNDRPIAAIVRGAKEAVADFLSRMSAHAPTQRESPVGAMQAGVKEAAAEFLAENREAIIEAIARATAKGQQG